MVILCLFACKKQHGHCQRMSSITQEPCPNNLSQSNTKEHVGTLLYYHYPATVPGPCNDLKVNVRLSMDTSHSYPARLTSLTSSCTAKPAGYSGITVLVHYPTTECLGTPLALVTNASAPCRNPCWIDPLLTTPLCSPPQTQPRNLCIQRERNS